MFDIGFWELVMIALVALIVVGPERLPKMVRVAGLWFGRANASVQSIRNEIASELRAEELRQALNETIDDVPDLNKIIDIESITKKTEPKTDSTVELKTETEPQAEPKTESAASAKKDEDGNG